MKHQAELDFLMKALEKMNLQALLLTPENMGRQMPDLGLRRILGMESLYEQALRHVPGTVRSNSIHKITDEFMCNYFFLRLPETAEVHLIIGPYVSFPVAREQLLEEAERYGISTARFARFEMTYASIPVLRDDSAVFALLNAFGETLWGRGSAFEFVDIALDLPLPSTALQADDTVTDPEELTLRMQTMEKRYLFESKLIEYVSHGLTSRAERMIQTFTVNALDQRVPDPIRNVKNYCIVCNTLMRKAAEKGGVHPLQLDQHSATLARRIELISNPQEGMDMMLEMVQIYCRLVRKHTVGKYPPLVQKTLTYIDSNLSGDLRLQTLACAQNVSGSYLSALFHRAYGKTLSECITEKRVENAAVLLQTTHLQVQTVAQHCGFSDVNYFSKAFKKYYAMTPRQYREKYAFALRSTQKDPLFL